MSVVTIHEAKTHLSKLIQRALAGEEIIIAKRDEPLVRLEVIQEKKPERTIGGLKGIILRMDDSFDDELEDFREYRPENPVPHQPSTDK
ncbi:MAG: type II toxin-antitoxin system Phd/YefM family antitoxin [Verrucomicrobiaceae bacterium]|nr:MAG: type II toxin-antitoxin system Phd/YefM family antitoxin [Verrucomicrobiaceae bacterium]